ncbi:MAG: galactokinase [Lachnospiraceae bacterium]|nr:galactokinase [Lachnospiraceae bacterium]
MKQRMIEKFEEIYGKDGEVSVYFAPGRANLIGEHTDYNGGHIFACTLTAGTYVAARKRPDNRFRFCSLNYPDSGILDRAGDELDYREEDNWGNYPKGVIRTFIAKGYPVEGGLDLLYYGEIPKGLGIGSSASINVATGLILRDLMGLENVTKVDIALFSALAEGEYMKNGGGILDPFTVAMGKKDHAILLDTSDFSYSYSPLDLPHEKVIITNSGKAREGLVERTLERRHECDQALRELQRVISINNLCELTAEVFEQVQEMIKSPVCVRRARHVITENQRTRQAVEAMQKGDIREFGQLMNASHLSLKEDYEVSCEELDILVEEAWELDGVVGSRMMGAGYGGCTVSIVGEDSVSEFIEKVGTNYTRRTGRRAEFYVVETGDGATRL